MKITRAILQLFVVVWFSQIDAAPYSQKTFLMPRNAFSSSAIQRTGKYQVHNATKQQGKAKISASALFQQSRNAQDLGNYFGLFAGRNTFQVGAPNPDIDDDFLFHLAVLHGGQVPQGLVKLLPAASSYGCSVMVEKEFSCLGNACFFRVHMPFVYVRQGVKIKMENDRPMRAYGKQYSIPDYFAGRVRVTQQDEPENIQDPLTMLKIDGPRSLCGIADIDASFATYLYQTKRKSIKVAAHVVVPTGNKVTSEYLFEPVCGNGHHLGFGASVDATSQLYKNSVSSCSVNLAVQYWYLCQNSQKRVPGYKFTNDGGFWHYVLGYKIPNQHNPPVTLEPLANLLPHNVKVKPGSQFETHFDVSLAYKKFVLDIGYNLFWKDQESVWLQDKLDNVGLALFVDRTTADDLSLSTGVGPRRLLYDDRLNIDSIKTPTQVTHKLFAALSHKFYISNAYPVLATLGGSYELVQDNAALEQYAVWAKCGIAF